MLRQGNPLQEQRVGVLRQSVGDLIDAMVALQGPGVQEAEQVLPSYCEALATGTSKPPQGAPDRVGLCELSPGYGARPRKMIPCPAAVAKHQLQFIGSAILQRDPKPHVAEGRKLPESATHQHGVQTTHGELPRSCDARRDQGINRIHDAAVLKKE